MSSPGPLWEAVGLLAATLTTAAFVPQVWLSWRSGNLAGVSMGMYAALALGIVLWLLYGLALGSWPLILANAISLLLTLAMLGMAWRWRRRQRAARDDPPAG